MGVQRRERLFRGFGDRFAALRRELLARASLAGRARGVITRRHCQRLALATLAKETADVEGVAFRCHRARRRVPAAAATAASHHKSYCSVRSALGATRASSSARDTASTMGDSPQTNTRPGLPAATQSAM